MTENTLDAVTVALAGNPNVGKSTVFNALTGMKQHTGNWAGKTVGCADGTFKYKDISFRIVDLPGCYSLYASTGEEKTAGDFLLTGNPDAAVTVCDATCLERNLILALQVCELHPASVICVNLLDEAAKKGVCIDTDKLSEELGIPVIGMSARSGRGIRELKDALTEIRNGSTVSVRYPDETEALISKISSLIEEASGKLNASLRGLALGLIRNDESIISILRSCGCDPDSIPDLSDILGNLTDSTVHQVFSTVIHRAEELTKLCTHKETETSYTRRMRHLDKILTGKFTAFPFMALLLTLILWITVEGANYPSGILSGWLFALQDKMYDAAVSAGWPMWLSGALIMGVYRVLAWVISVMLPPMAIFFPLFTLLEDFGYLPRVAFNLDSTFKRCHACGKQALTMCMGFGCNAVGVTGCRIIDSRRERLIAILTNVFVPCNGRFPTLITLITLFFAVGSGLFGSILSAFMLCAVICLGIMLTFLLSYILSKTLLRGEPSSFTLELPPYRTPQVGKVIIRSVFDRTLFVLGRAAAVAAPAGLIIWLCGSVQVGDASLLTFLCGILDPFASLFGLDGVILLSFILGFPANEIVIPVMVMAYTQTSTVTELEGAALHELLILNGWTAETAVCTMLFCLCHFPCSTTLITIFKETGSKKLTVLSAVIPTLTGLALCFIAHLFFGIFS